MSTGTVAITPIPIPGALVPGLLPILPVWRPPTAPLTYEGGGGLGTIAR
jgi:hypothetical protein